MKVAIDPGHGGSDPGAVGPTGSQEADIALAIGLRLKNLLETSDIEVIMSRETDIDCAGLGVEEYQELQARCDFANLAGADLFVSIHCNAASNPNANGTETWYYEAGYDLAESVQYQLGVLGLADRGIKQGNFYILKYTDMPAILAEVAFISNPQEEALLNNTYSQQAVAEAISRGIETLGVRGWSF